MVENGETIKNGKQHSKKVNMVIIIFFFKSKTVNNGKKGSNIVKNGHKWPKRAKNSQKRSKMVKEGQNCQQR